MTPAFLTRWRDLPTLHRLLALALPILLLAAAIRIAGLGAQPLWIDEAFSYLAVKSPDLLTALIRDVHPPLYFALLRVWASVMGVSEFALRFPSVLFGVLSVALMLPLAREVNRLRPAPRESAVPLLAVLLLAVSEFGFYVAQETRSYSLHVLLAVLSMWAFLRWMRTDSRAIAGVWVLATTALLYTYYLGAWVGVTQGLYALAMLRERQRIVAVSLLTVPLMLFSVWLLGVVLPYQTAKADSHATIDPSTLQTLIRYAHLYLTQQWALMLGLLILGVLDVRGGRIQAHVSRGAALMLLWIGVAVLLTFIGNIQFSIMTNYRIAQITVPLALLWAFGLAAFHGRTRVFLVAIVTLYGVFTVDVTRTYYPWDVYAGRISAYAQAGDVVLMDFGGVDFSMEYYLERQLPPDVRLYSLRSAAIWESERLYGEIPAAIADARAVWVAQWNSAPLAPSLLNGFTRTHRDVFSFQGIDVETLRYDRLDEGALPLARFRNGMILERVFMGDDPLRVDLLWRAEQPPQADFTVSAFLLDADGRLVAQLDSMPFENQRPTRTWTPDTFIYDPRRMVTTDGAPLPAGVYRVGVKVYRYLPDGTLRDIPLEDGAPFVIVGDVSLTANP